MPELVALKSRQSTSGSSIGVLPAYAAVGQRAAGIFTVCAAISPNGTNWRSVDMPTYPTDDLPMYPNLIRYNGMYWMAYQSSNNCSISIFNVRTSDDLVNWSDAVPHRFHISDEYWEVPDWFIDGSGKLGLTLTSSVLGDSYGFVLLNNGTPDDWSAASLIRDSSGSPIVGLEFLIRYHNGMYFLFVHDIANMCAVLYTSSTVDHGYTQVGTFNFAEQFPAGVTVVDGIMRCWLFSYTTGQLSYIESSDGGTTWSSLVSAGNVAYVPKVFLADGQLLLHLVSLIISVRESFIPAKTAAIAGSVPSLSDLINVFGSPDTLGDGFVGCLRKDGTNSRWLCVTQSGTWSYVALTQAS